jgi:hypothetical protein
MSEDEETMSRATVYLVVGIGVGVAVLIICIVGLILVCRSVQPDPGEKPHPADEQGKHDRPPGEFEDMPERHQVGPPQ